MATMNFEDIVYGEKSQTQKDEQREMLLDLERMIDEEVNPQVAYARTMDPFTGEIRTIEIDPTDQSSITSFGVDMETGESQLRGLPILGYDEDALTYYNSHMYGETATEPAWDETGHISGGTGTTPQVNGMAAGSRKYGGSAAKPRPPLNSTLQVNPANSVNAFMNSLGLDFLRYNASPPTLKSKLCMSGAVNISIPFPCHHMVQENGIIALVTDLRNDVAPMIDSIDKTTSVSIYDPINDINIDVYSPPQLQYIDIGVVRIYIFMQRRTFNRPAAYDSNVVDNR